MDDQITLIADMTNYRVGCVLIQAVAGCRSDLLYDLGFDTNTWDLSPTPTQSRITGTREQWLRFAELCNQTHLK